MLCVMLLCVYFFVLFEVLWPLERLFADLWGVSGESEREKGCAYLAYMGFEGRVDCGGGQRGDEEEGEEEGEEDL